VAPLPPVALVARPRRAAPEATPVRRAAGAARAVRQAVRRSAYSTTGRSPSCGCGH